jgi:hypothetical protein
MYPNTVKIRVLIVEPLEMDELDPRLLWLSCPPRFYEELGKNAGRNKGDTT